MFNIEDSLKEKGFEITTNEDDLILAKNDAFLVRAIQSQNIFQVGNKQNFDRWANSVDFEFEYPYTDENMTTILNKIGV